MLRIDKNIKDISENSITDSLLSTSYTKTTKLITALYMVTNIIDADEPIRHKLRQLGTEILSDIHHLPKDACGKIVETVSFLNIASAMNLISEMNCTILKKEFLDLDQSIKESTQIKPTWLADFLLVEHSIGHKKIDRHQTRTRIGVQKGSTLMKALSDKTHHLSNGDPVNVDRKDFEILKKKRRENIINIIKNSGGNVAIKDIKDKLNSEMPKSLTYSEKTLQRELLSMIKDNVLSKTGEKRWSRYSLASNQAL